jgi:Carbohydrate-selective porin, OprB family/S-layer homology domain
MGFKLHQPWRQLWTAALIGSVAAAPLATAQASQDRRAMGTVVTIGDFSDVRPSDWAYQALQSLLERHGCVSGSAVGTLNGSAAITRFEAAALLNSCLGQSHEASEQLNALRREWAQELAVLQGRIDSVEARTGALEAMRFSPTTRMSMLTRSALGAVQYGGNQVSTANNTWGQGKGSLPLRNAFTFNYDIMLFLDSTTTGKDLLRTILRMANFGASAFGIAGGNNPAPLTQLDEGFEDPTGRNVIGINRLFYRTALNNFVTISAGPRIRQNDALPVWPTIYARPGSELLLKIFTQAGSTSAYSLLIGPGAGLILKNNSKNTGWSAGVNYIATNGDKGNSSVGGMGTAGSAATAMAQLSYTGPRWNVSLAAAQNGAGVRQDGTNYWRTLQPQLTSRLTNNGATETLSVAGYWQPLKPGLIPTISAGYGYNQANLNNSPVMVSGQPLQNLQSAGWMAGFTWDNAFENGNQIGFAVGQPTFVTAVNGQAANDGNYVFELYYKIQATNYLLVTPTLFYLSRPRGE